MLFNLEECIGGRQAYRTGGTAAAGINLIRALGGNVSGCGFIINLPEIGGAKKLKSMGVEVKSLVVFEGH